MKDFITFEIAKKLKEKGFNEPCYKYYQKGVLDSDDCWNRYNKGTADRCSAPTISQVLKWLRKEKEIMVFPAYSTNTSKWYCVVVNADSLEQYNLSLSDSYEQAALAGIEYVLDNLL